MLETPVVQVTGRGSNVNLDIDDSTPFDDVVQGLRNHLSANRLMYSKGTITVNVGRRMLDKEELTGIKQLIEKESGVTVSRFWCPPNVLEEALSKGVGFGVAISPKEERAKRESPRPEVAHNDPRFFAKPQSPEPAGLELWAPYMMEIAPRVENGEPPNSKNAMTPPATPKGQQKKEPSRGKDTAEQVPEDKEAQAHSAEVSDPHGNDRGPHKGESLAPSSKPNQSPKDQDTVSPATKATTSSREINNETTFGTRWEEVGPTGVAAAKRIGPAGELSGLNRGNEALLIKTHCRSGEVIRYPGDVVVMADVNPGSEIIADGDILVFGSLRGFAHAGAGGDIQATIIAQNFETPRLQIGPYVGVDPKPKRRSKSNSISPRIAYVRRRSVFVAPYTGRFGEYSGGTLYDG